MKNIIELEKELQKKDLSENQIQDLHFHLSASYLNIDNKKSSDHAKKYLQNAGGKSFQADKVKIIKRIMDLDKSEVSQKDICRLLFDIGDLFRRNQLDNASFYYQKAQKIVTDLNDSDLIAENYTKLSYIHNKKGEYKDSEQLLEKAIALAKELTNKSLLSKCYSQFGEIYYYKGAFEKTLEYYLKSLQLDEESGDIREISKSYNNIGTVYYRIREYEKAEEFFAKALEMKLKLPDKSGLAFCYNNLGAINFILKKYEKALELYQESLSVREELEDLKGQVSTCSNIGGVYYELKELSEAQNWFNRAYKLSLQIGDKHNAALVIGNMANTYTELGDYKKAVECAEIELKLAEELNELPLESSAYRALTDAYEKQGDFKKALEYYKGYSYLLDQIYHNDSEKKISEIKAKYDVEAKEREAEIHRLKNVELVEANKTIQKKNDQLQAYKDDLLLINKILTHDIANDLAVIQSAIEIYKETSAEEILIEMEKRTRQSIRTIREQRNLVSSLDSADKLKSYTFENILSGLSTSHERLEIKINGKGAILADEAIYSVFENLTNNAVIHGKATSININIENIKNTCLIRFADNGKGIPNEVKSKIFMEGFSHGDSGNTGIGLHIVKNTIDRYGGSISVEDNIPHGTVFVITLKSS